MGAAQLERDEGGLNVVGPLVGLSALMARLGLSAGRVYYHVAKGHCRRSGSDGVSCSIHVLSSGSLRTAAWGCPPAIARGPMGRRQSVAADCAPLRVKAQPPGTEMDGGGK